MSAKKPTSASGKDSAKAAKPSSAKPGSGKPATGAAKPNGGTAAAAAAPNQAKAGAVPPGRVDMPPPVPRAQVDPARDPRRMRRILAEDPQWNVSAVPLLSELCLNSIVANFKDFPIIRQLPAAVIPKLLAKLDVNLPISITAPLIHDDVYWRRCCEARWPLCDVTQHGASWKRLFFERNLQDLLEAFVPGTTDRSLLDQTLALSGPFVQRLDLGELRPPADATFPQDKGKLAPKPHSSLASTAGTKDPTVAGSASTRGGGDDNDDDDDDDDDDASFATHSRTASGKPKENDPNGNLLDNDDDDDNDGGDDALSSSDHIAFDSILSKLPALESLSVSFGVRDCGMNFKWSLFVMTMADVKSLCRAVQLHPKITSLSVHRSGLNDALTKELAIGLAGSKTLSTLNLAHNSISDSGARALAGLVGGNGALTELDLRDNQVRKSGAKALGFSLESNTSLKSLNLRMNPISDAGAQPLLTSLISNKTLRSLSLAGSSLTSESAAPIARLLSAPQAVLQELDLSGNDLGDGAGQVVARSVAGNKKILVLDSRLCKFSPDSDKVIQAVLKANKKAVA